MDSTTDNEVKTQTHHEVFCEKLKEISECARYEVDPRKPAAELAAAMLEFFNV
jgi:hypothetical protein